MRSPLARKAPSGNRRTRKPRTSPSAWRTTTISAGRAPAARPARRHIAPTARRFTISPRESCQQDLYRTGQEPAGVRSEEDRAAEAVREPGTEARGVVVGGDVHRPRRPRGVRQVRVRVHPFLDADHAAGPLLRDELDGQGSEPVSYTHLRAHETRHDLVCRLLLEKK